MDAYTNLTDDIVHRILLSEPTDHHIMRAKEILQNIHKRKLYKCVGESVPITDADTIEKQVRLDFVWNCGNVFTFKSGFN